MRLFLATIAVGLTAVLGAASAFAGDKEIAQSVIKQFRERQSAGQLKGFNINLRVDKGDVLLDGHVSNPEQKALALDIARRVPGVNQVVDGITVKKASPATTIANMERSQARTPARTVSTTSPRAAGQPARSVVRQSTVAANTPVRFASQTPLAFAPAMGGQMAPTPAPGAMPAMGGNPPMPAYVPGTGGGVAPATYDHPTMPPYAWPSYAAYPNYAAVTYPRQHSAAAWPYIGPFYPYPQVPLGWRKVVLEWDDGWWMLDFKAK
jgi:hypothetical protein